MGRVRPRWALLLSLALLTASCPQTYSVRLKPLSAISSLTLSLGGGRPKPVDLVTFATCAWVDSELLHHEGQSVWSAFGQELPDSTRRYREITYGQSLSGFTETTPPSELIPGCYLATVVADGATGSIALWVDSLGSVREWTKRDYDSASTQDHNYAILSNARADSAIALCLAAYRVATTAEDSGSVDKRVFGDSPNAEAFACREYRRLYWSRFKKRPGAEDSTAGGA